MQKNNSTTLQIYTRYKGRMLVSPGLAMLFLLRSSNAELCPEPCKCKFVAQGMIINCSSRGLQELPFIPENTTELYLHNNILTTVAPGAFDKLQNLQAISLYNNIWNCDCHIAYLKQWLQNPPTIVQSNATCFTPIAVRKKPVAELRGLEYSRCHSYKQHQCRDIYFKSIALCLLLLLFLLLMLFSFISFKSKSYVFTPNIGLKESDLIPLVEQRTAKRHVQNERTQDSSIEL
ncbi:platelet glycoprotein IX isoform X2 [Stegostoma tigrinum]|uniref:platelet glycoprotein IX isoform X2 n=1 Tax=Stegostoma tigrinum TaxID=3053191 RepID=UPI00202B978D|nr:platelet glycoprotein IX isoform X2 [Stegostoma tigrinum]